MLTLETRLSLDGVGPDPRTPGQVAAVIRDETVLATTPDGNVAACRYDGIAWTSSGDGRVASIGADADLVVAGERGGGVRALSLEAGETLWERPTGDVARSRAPGQPTVVDVYVAGETVVVAEIDPGTDGRSPSSAVSGFDRDGSRRWRYDVSASLAAIEVADGRVATAYGRCPADHDNGLVVLDLETGAELVHWDPGTPGERRVGDVALADDAVAVASLGDGHGYLLDETGAETWCVRPADGRTPEPASDAARPSHVGVVDGTVVFATDASLEGTPPDSNGARVGRAVVAVVDGRIVGTRDVPGSVSDLSTANSRVAVSSVRDRGRTDGAGFVGLLDADLDALDAAELPGHPVATALSNDRLAAIERRDAASARAGYRLHVWRIEGGTR